MSENPSNSQQEENTNKPFKNTRRFLPIKTSPSLFYGWINSRLRENKSHLLMVDSVGLKICIPTNIVTISSSETLIQIFANATPFSGITDYFDSENQILLYFYRIEELREDEIRVEANMVNPLSPDIEKFYYFLSEILVQDYPEATSKSSERIKSADPYASHSLPTPVQSTLVLLEPWRKSRPNRQDRDKVIWESREENYTWEEVAEKANTSVETSKRRYKKMKALVENCNK